MQRLHFLQVFFGNKISDVVLRYAKNQENSVKFNLVHAVKFKDSELGHVRLQSLRLLIQIYNCDSVFRSKHAYLLKISNFRFQDKNSNRGVPYL